MIELDTEDRRSVRLGDPAYGVGTKLGGQAAAAPTVPADSSLASGAGRDNGDSPSAAIVLLIRERLEQHPHFRGRTSLLEIELVEGATVLSGRLPSYYLKQLLQEAVRLMPGVVDIDNRVLIMWPHQ